MGLIRILPEILINKIAAGEVVERPASVVKELIENSIDAGADEIIVEILHGGKKLIKVSDNGAGMSKEDAILSFERHATSKIYEEGDLYKINTMGFRGEALPSITSVSKVLMVTSLWVGSSKESSSSSGTRIEIEGGKMPNISETGPSKGTIIEVRDLFFNTPARLAFLKGINTELSHIVGAVESASLGHPEISFSLSNNRKAVLSLPKARDYRERINQIYGRELVENLMEVGHGHPLKDINGITLSGYISNPPYSRPDRGMQVIFINRRPVRNQVISHAISEGFQSMIMKDRYPAAFLFLEIDTKEVDVNVHPSKREVRFRNSSMIHDIVVRAIKETLSGRTPEEIPTIPPFQKGGEEGIMVKEALERYMKRSENILEGGRQAGFDFQIKAKSPIPEAFLHVFNSYIVTAGEDGVMIIDQHAAHERILYESLRGDKIEIQGLLVPVTIELSSRESLILKEKLDTLKAIGIEIEEFGDNTFIIRSIPAILKDADHRSLVLNIIGDLDEKIPKIDELERIRTLMACHGAVRANQSLTSEEMASLIEELEKTELPHTCPHGRPTTIRFGLRDLEKLFKRK